MRKFLAAVVILFILALAGGVVVLGTWDLPAPTATVEKPIAHDRVFR